MIEITRTNCNFEREPLLSPFGFKGGYLSELWQSVVLLESSTGEQGIGLGTQSVLWSDAKIFSTYAESAGNGLMFLLTEFALNTAKGMQFSTPPELLRTLLPLVHAYGKKITGNADLRLTFALNALVAVDNAAWQLYCREHDIHSFDGMIPQQTRPALAKRHEVLTCIPLITYGVPLPKIKQTIEDGYGFLKIKIGSDPDGDGDQNKMLEWDQQRLSAIHELAREQEVPYTVDGHIPYYLDANGRYQSKECLLRFLDHADKIGALERILLLEEPFPEEQEFDVHDIPVRLAADESAHSDKEALARIEMGYGAIALKPIAKTLSMSFTIAQIAHERGVPCFCADLTVNPILVDWNKNVASRLNTLPGMTIGVLETNGQQNYAHWDTMKTYHPGAGARWLDPEHGIFTLEEDFYARSGCILDVSQHYRQRV